jgi:hypothetical protein
LLVLLAKLCENIPDVHRGRIAFYGSCEFGQVSGAIQAREGYDFVISHEGAGIILDVFEAGKTDSDDAHRESMFCDSPEAAKEAAQIGRCFSRQFERGNPTEILSCRRYP